MNKKGFFFCVAITRIVLLSLGQTFHALTIVFTKCRRSLSYGSLGCGSLCRIVAVACVVIPWDVIHYVVAHCAVSWFTVFWFTVSWFTVSWSTVSWFTVSWFTVPWFAVPWFTVSWFTMLWFTVSWLPCRGCTSQTLLEPEARETGERERERDVWERGRNFSLECSVRYITSERSEPVRHLVL